MAQAPATPKTTRVLRRLLAPVSTRLAAFGHPAPSELAALALRRSPALSATGRGTATAAALARALTPAAAPLRTSDAASGPLAASSASDATPDAEAVPASAPPEAAANRPRTGADTDPIGPVVFLVPLVGPAQVGDWQAVTARLAATLESFRAQDDPAWRAVVCCQDRPVMPDDPRIAFLPFDDPAPGNDKWRKLAALADHLSETGPPRGYVMSFDADDLLRRGAVAEMRARGAPGGYLVETGYVRDVSNGVTALAGPPTLAQPLRKPFWKLCGSCAALRVDRARGPAQGRFLREMLMHEHRMFPYLARLAGQPLTPLSRPSVLYLLNHGENFGARRGRVSFKTRFVERYRVTDPATLEAIRTEFP